MVESLNIDKLYKRCDCSKFGFKTTLELEDLDEIIGQARALKAISFGVGIKHEGYNLFVMGTPGSGRHTIVEEFIKNEAANQPIPNDWCYINNFDDSRKPISIELPPNWGSKLKKDMEELVEVLKSTIPATFESEECISKKQAINDKLKQKQEEAFEDIKERAKKDSVAIKYTTTGVTLAPMKDGKILTPGEYQSLSDKNKNEIQDKINAYKEEIDGTSQQVVLWSRQAQEEIKELERKMTKKSVSHMIDELKQKYKKFPKVIHYFNNVENDVVEYAQDFLPPRENSPIIFLESVLPQGLSTFSRYNVNVLVTHEDDKGVPIIYEDNPTYSNLFGHIDHVSQMGTLVTDFNLIKPGALHKANGGYLIMNARKLFFQPYIWEGLKRMLQSQEIRIETLAEALSYASTVSLEPETIKLDVKVVLIGERILYYLLYNYDSEFKELFKINADFEEEMPRSEENTLLYAQMIAMLAKKNSLLPIERDAVGRVIEYSSRIVGDAYKLSTHLKSINDLLFEADFIAKERESSIINKDDINKAAKERINRSDRIKDMIYEEIQRGTILIETDGAVEGQVNGVSIIDLGNFSFGQPIKITALTRIGKGEVVDIEKEVNLGGPIHSKGVMILSSYLASKYAKEFSLSLSATLVFEQSYTQIEGDSASLAELYALISSLSKVPIKQSFAVTGSLNQNGHIQAVGGINEKIEGFFDVCQLKKENHKHGIVIPASNVKHLMLKEEVIEAVKNGEFEIYAISDVDEGIEILTGKEGGVRKSNGQFPKESINYLVERRLKELAQKAKENYLV